MTTSNGGRDDLMSGAYRDADEREDEPQLRAMRTVWLAMRDEDPPDRGLAELLAAARAKAETMQVRPTLWQRAVAGLRPPPALAFATVLVLVGGAVILGRRGMEVSAPVSIPEVSGRATASPVPREAPMQVAAPGATGRAAPAAGSGRAEAFGPADGGSARLPAAVTPASPHGSPAPVPPTAKIEMSAEATTSPKGLARAGMVDGRAAPMPAVVTPESVASADLAGAVNSVHDEAGAPPPADADEVATAGEATTIVARGAPQPTKRDKQQAPSATLLAQLYKQCEGAARRGDCVAVRELVGRITKTDRGYRARVAKDSPVAKCLAE